MSTRHGRSQGPASAAVTAGHAPHGRSEKSRIRSLRQLYAWYLKPVLWRAMNPGAAPEDYYARMISNRLKKGEAHPAIGPASRPVRASSELLDILLAHGLQPQDGVVDYGCGSFRLGKALIEHLEPGRYWGLDVLEDFLTHGMDLLEPELKAGKRPNARVINEANLAAVRAARPRFVISWHVCSKVPPNRLPDYFGKMLGLLPPGGLLLVHFPETGRRVRQSRYSWTQSRETIAAVVRTLDPAVEIDFAPITDQVHHGVRQTMVKVRRPA
jgi:hypothetical protein